MFFTGVYDKQRRWQSAHVFDATQRPLQSIHLLFKMLRFFLWQALKFTTLFAALQVFQVADAYLNGLEIGEHPTEPALVHIKHPAALRFLLHCFLRLLFRANKEDALPLGSQSRDKFVGFVQATDGLLEIDDMNTIALRKDEGFHLWVPAACLMPKVDASL